MIVNTKKFLFHKTGKNLVQEHKKETTSETEA
jgi:hypothetical protein